MTTKQLMTYSAFALAGVALWYFSRKPGGQVHAQPGQAQRDTALQAWHDTLDAQRVEIENTSYALSLDRIQGIGVLQ